MKQPKKLTRNQKENLTAYGLNPNDYMFLEDISDSYYKVIHKQDGKKKVIDKYAKKRR